uniref:[histone H3]-trimethyl-L-lysine(9) demethylase n=1 Tax=Denticeps clupeoides TaxID=299321 RepID=A0AAY4B6Z7_9TELE
MGLMSSDSTPQNSVSRIMTFHPTKEEFKGFSRYIAYIESQGAHKAGMAKIVPPKDWTPRQTYDDIDDLVIPVPIQQVVTGQSGLFTQYNIQKKPMTVREFRRIANTDRFCNPRYVDFDELERKYWKNLTFNPPLYGADISGSLYDPNVTEWNIGQLNTILDTVERESGIKIKGVNTPYLYFGMWKSTFAWHTEDMDLYSINYLHFGEPKSWYCVPPEHGKRLERLAKGFFPGSAQSCEAFLRHKMTLISPSILKKYGIPFEKVTQEAGEFIVTFPYAYHAGFNHGFNCAESTNFATQRWIDYGKQATLCSCRKDMVKISMDLFVRKFQPERYKLWEAGKDNTPIDHSKPTPEAAEFLQNGKDGFLLEPQKEEKTSEGGDQGVGEEAASTAVEEEKNYSPEPLKPESPSEDDSLAQLPESQDKTSPEPSTLSLVVKVNSEAPKPDASTPKPSTKSSTGPHTPRSAAKALIPTSPALLSSKPKPAMDTPGPSEPSLPPPSSRTSPEHRIFQRTLSPAEVLHVHSYAKGDYCSEPETPRREERHFAEDCSLQSNSKNRLTKLPRHHPLMKDSMSDEGKLSELFFNVQCGFFGFVFMTITYFSELQDQAAVDEDGLEGELWAKPLTHLWQNRHCSLEKEKEYNRSMGLQRPYCAVCMLFQTYQRTECGEGEPAPPVGPAGKQRTKPLIPEMCFSTTTEDSVETHLSTPYLEEDGTSLLISCAQCCVRVHTSCYGINPKSVTKGWKCTRCKANAMTEVVVLNKYFAWFCRWVHVLCAVAVLEARFVNITRRSPVDLSGIPLQRFKLKCYYCKRRMKKTSGCCVQCSHGRCPTSYHPTCAQAAGILMQPDDWPFIVHVTCCRHKGPVQTELTVGQKVICKHKNGRYYQCDVVQLSKETFYEVNFDDGSFSDNLFPEDIVNRDCSLLGPPAQGEVVQVRWTDGLVYGAKFVAAHVIQMYQVEFEDGSQLTAKRDDVYTLDEELPKRVKSRLVSGVLKVFLQERSNLFLNKKKKNLIGVNHSPLSPPPCSQRPLTCDLMKCSVRRKSRRQRDSV